MIDIYMHIFFESSWVGDEHRKKYNPSGVDLFLLLFKTMQIIDIH